MIRKRLNMIFSSKLFFIIFSVLIACALWMYVEINENQVIEHRVSNIQVVRLNEQILNDRDLLVSALTPESITLTFECSRSVANRLKTDTVSVSIDLSVINSRGSVTLPYELNLPSNVDGNEANVVNRSDSRISLYIDRMERRPVQVNVTYTGGAAEGYIQDPVEYGPRTVLVSGPTEIVSQISEARVTVIRENLTSTITDDLPFVLYDVGGEEISQDLFDQLSFSDEMITVTVPIKMTGTVALTVERIYGSGATEQNVNITVDPPWILVSGDPEEVRDLNSIILGTVDLTRFEYSNPYTFQIVMTNNNITNMTGVTEASVFAEVLGLEIKLFSISNINYVNEPAGHTVDIISRGIDVRIRGKAEDMVNLTEDNIRVVANLSESNLGTGTQRVPARVYIDGIDADIGAVGAYNVIVSVTRDP